ncbi:MAG: Ig-like domain-containing protein, partial [Microbacteriaceae bacterium]
RAAGQPGPRDRFRPTVVAVLLVLAVVAGALAVTTALTGPRLRSAALDASATTRSDAQLRLTLDLPPATIAAEDVEVSPDVTVSAEVSGSVVVLTFAAPLRADTRYTVTLAGVRSRYGSPAADIRYRFTTDTAELYYLDRSSDPDTVYRAGLGAAGTSDAGYTAVYTAPTIDAFVHVGSILVVAAESDGESSLAVVDIASGASAAVELPTTGVVSRLVAADSGTVVAAVFTSDDAEVGPLYDAALFTVDFATSVLDEVAGLSGQVEHVDGIAAVPGSTAFAVHTDAGDTALVDPSASASGYTPLGSFTEFDGVATDGGSVIVGDAAGTIELSLADGSQTRLQPSPIDGVEPYGGQLLMLRDGVRIQRVAIPDPDSGLFSTEVVRDDGSVSTPLYGQDADAGEVLDMSVSANDQYLVLEIDPDADDLSRDGYLVDPRPTDVQIVVLDAETGESLRFAAGGAVGW